MKKALFYYTIALKSIMGFGDPITQETIEGMLEKYPAHSVKYYKNFECPRYIRSLSQEMTGEEWKQDFPFDISAYSCDELYKNLSLSNVSAFETHSRELTKEEIDKVSDELKTVRVIDFKSIIAGLHNEDINNFLNDLESGAKNLEEELQNWIKEKDIYAYFDIDSYSIPYIPNEGIQKQCKTKALEAIKMLLNYPAGQQTLTLVLCIEKFENKVLKLFITDEGPWISCKNEVYLNFSEKTNLEAQSLYHEFNHWIHYVLGLQSTSKIAGNFSTVFEKGFFQLRKASDYVDSIEKINEGIPLNENSCFRSEDKTKGLKIFDIQTTWESLEELWNIIGFADVNDCIYVNRLSDMDLLKNPRYGYDLYYDDIKDSILKEWREEGPKKPNNDAWKIWVKLHNLPENTQYLFLPDCDQGIKELQMKLFNIPTEMNKIDRFRLLDSLLWDAPDWDDLLTEWTEENPVLHKDIENLKTKAKTIKEEAIVDFFNKAFPIENLK